MDARVLILPAGLALGAYRAWRLRDRGVSVGAALGLSLDARSVIDVVVGAFVSSISLATVFLLEWRLGLLTVQGHGSAASLTQEWSNPVVVGFIEEFIYRSAVLGVLLLWTSAPVAVAMSAAIFAAAHLPNAHVSMLAIVCHFVGGVVYGAAFVRTGRLWLPFGLHMGWNYTEGRLLGFGLSGGVVPNPFILQHDNGPAFWTGDGYGLEGGMLGVVAKILVFALLLPWLHRTNRESASVAGGPTTG
jgi:membrane protease YdiL (CAAX protease family)